MAMNRSRNALHHLVISTLILLGTSLPLAAADKFPRYDVIEPNVDFWVKIYAHHPTTQVVIHDSRNLGIVYDVIAVKPYDAPGARKINRNRTKRAKAQYRDILERLAANPQCTDEACQRVARLFGPGADAQTFRRASRQVRSQLGQKDRFRAGLIRSGAYLDEIRTILKSYGVPEDLAYLPHVESSFNPSAYSKFGAAGIWQFTRSTGRRFMKVGYVLDERRDPIRATHAAAQLLRENYAKLGSWPLAITAYNHGAAGMARARQKHGGYPAIFTSYRSRTFKFASRNFYSEFLAARQVAGDYTTHFGELRLDDPKPFHMVTMAGYIRLQDLSRHYGISPETVRKLNPALRPPVFNDQKYVPKGYALRLPPADGRDAVTLAAIPSALFKPAQKPSRFYTVQRGDTAGRIARQHGVRLSDLILANNLGSRATIYPKQTLRIPLPGEKVAPPKPQAPVLVASVEQATTDSETAPQKKAAAQKSAASEDIRPEQAGFVPAPLKAPPKAEPAVPVAQADAPPATSASQGAPASEAEATPELSKPAVSAPEVPSPPAETDQTVSRHPPESASLPTIPDETQPILTAEAGPLSAEPPSSPVATEAIIGNPEIVAVDVRLHRKTRVDQRLVGVLQVEVEETLGHFAEWAGVRTQEIRRLNGLRYGRTLHLHQKVKIPLDKTSAGEFEEQRYEYHKRLQEDFFAVYRVGELEVYRVQSGDNYWTLCREKFGVPMWLLKHYNMEADLAALQIHQKLMIPLIEKTDAGDPGAVASEEAAES